MCPCPPGEAFSDFVTTWQSLQALQRTPQDKQPGAGITTVFGVTQNPNIDCGAAIGSFVLEKLAATTEKEAEDQQNWSKLYYRCLGLQEKFEQGQRIEGFFDELFPDDIPLAKWVTKSRPHAHSNKVAQCGITWVGDKFLQGSNKVKFSLPSDVADKIKPEWYGGEATEMEAMEMEQVNNEDEDQGRNLKRSRFGQYKSILDLESLRRELKPLFAKLVHDRI